MRMHTVTRAGILVTATTSMLLASVAAAAADPGSEPVEPGPPAAQAAAAAPGAENPPVAPRGPQPAPPPSGIGNPLALAGSDQGPGGLPGNLPIAGNPNLLGQNAAPAAPGAAGPVNTPNLNPLNLQYTLSQNLEPAAPGQGQQYEVEPGHENDDVGKGEYIKRFWHRFQDGQFNGGMVGRRPKEELNQPLPGTAPPQGTRIPGLGDDSQGPAPEQWHWEPPPPPEAPEGAAPGPAPEPAAPGPAPAPSA